MDLSKVPLKFLGNCVFCYILFNGIVFSQWQSSSREVSGTTWPFYPLQRPYAVLLLTPPSNRHRGEFTRCVSMKLWLFSSWDHGWSHPEYIYSQ